MSCLVSGIQCYQCSTSSDPKGSDNCGAYEKFHKDRHVSVECTSDESHTPGTFCVKVTKQGLRGFICESKLKSVKELIGPISSISLYNNVILIIFTVFNFKGMVVGEM